MVRNIGVFCVLCLLLLFVSNAGGATLSRVGSGTQEDSPAGFRVSMWCSGAGPTVRTTIPNSQLIFGVVVSQAPFARQAFSPAYNDATYGCGSIDELQIELTGGAIPPARDQAVIKFNPAGGGATAASFVSATLTGLRVSDYHRTAGIVTNMAVGVYDLQAAQKNVGTVDETVVYPLGTLMSALSVASTVGATYSVDVSAAVLADLQAGRFSGFILYPETPRSGLEEISFDYPTLVVATVAPIPTVNEWGMIIIGILLAFLAVWQMRRMGRDPLPG